MKNKILLYLRMIKWHRILHAFSILKKEGIGGIKYHFYLVKDKEKGLEQNGGREYDVSPVIEMEDYPILVFEESIKPMVSIIIPVYNQFAYTYHCLKHINKYMDHIPLTLLPDAVPAIPKVVTSEIPAYRPHSLYTSGHTGQYGRYL